MAINAFESSLVLLTSTSLPLQVVPWEDEALNNSFSKGAYIAPICVSLSISAPTDIENPG